MIERLGLTEYADRRAGAFWRGNAQRLRQLPRRCFFMFVLKDPELAPVLVDQCQGADHGGSRC